MKLLLPLVSAFTLVLVLAKAQLGPENLPQRERKDTGADAAFMKEVNSQMTKRSKFADDSVAIRPDQVPGEIPPSDGLIALKALVASQRQTIELQRQEIRRLTQELDECRSKLSGKVPH